MFQNTLKTIAFALLGISVAQAQTYHRLPLASTSTPINAWKDDSTNPNIDTRYDGTNIPPSDVVHYYLGHRGTDFGVPYGTPVYASAKGAEYLTNNTCPPNGGYKGNSCGSSFGNYVAIKHADNMVSIVAHLSSVSVTFSSIACTSGPGGTLLGYSGNSGDSSGAHLHFELRINNLLATSASYDPFGGSYSTQWWNYWYTTTSVADPLRRGYYMTYPLTTCAP